MNREEEIQKEIKELKENINFADMDMAETNDSEYYDLVGLEAELKGIQQGKAEAIDKTLKLLEKIMQERKDILKLITKKIYSTEFKNYAINTEMTEGDLKFALDMRKLFANEIKELLGEITFSEKGYKLWLGIKSKINNKGEK